MERLLRVVGPVATNVHVLADPRTREAIAIDTAIPSLAWIADELAARDWTLKLIVSTHGHWDHIGDNAAVADAHRRGDRRPPARSRAADGPPADLRAVRDPAVRPGRRARRGRRDPRSARSGCGSSTRPATPRARSASSPRTTASCSAATRCSPGLGPRRPARRRRRRDGRVARPAHRARGPHRRPARPRAGDDHRPRAAWMELVRDGGRLFA